MSLCGPLRSGKFRGASFDALRSLEEHPRLDAKGPILVPLLFFCGGAAKVDTEYDRANVPPHNRHDPGPPLVV